YILMLNLLTEIQIKAETYESLKKAKLLGTADDKNPTLKFAENRLLNQLRTSLKLREVTAKRRVLNWQKDDEYVDLIFRAMLKSDKYVSYMASSTSDYKEDRQFILDLYKSVIAPNEKLYDYLEDQKITWLDDVPVVNTVLVKMLKKLGPHDSGNKLLPDLFRDEEDRQFGIDLLNKTLLNLTALNNIIEDKTTNWDKDRIAKIDLVLLQMAICELQKFPSIPVKVTINEYLEIAKEYSTPKSSIFINGILDKILKEYEAKGTLNKAGRGLM
ncbi:MAG: transcription antitermination factor NusB, partial [Bacteroidia bacterium]|nr:transcription antitermination factor NusB [Bacteroidia bacterium]